MIDGEVDAGREDNGRDEEDEDNGRDEEGEDNVGDTERDMVPESNVVETGLGCAVSTEAGTGIEDVNSGTGFWNEPVI